MKIQVPVWGSDEGIVIFIVASMFHTVYTARENDNSVNSQLPSLETDGGMLLSRG